MNTGELRALFRSYADEPDTSFLSDADVALYLSIGYNRFRALVNSTNDFHYAVGLDAIPNSREYTMAVDFDSILSISNVAPTSLLAYEELVAVTRPEELYSRLGSQRIRYYLRGSRIRFSTEVTTQIRIMYIPRHSVDFSQAADPIDTLGAYHDIIALLGYSNYAVRDGEINQPLEMLAQQRVSELRSYLQEGIAKEQSSTIADVPDWL